MPEKAGAPCEGGGLEQDLSVAHEVQEKRPYRGQRNHQDEQGDGQPSHPRNLAGVGAGELAEGRRQLRATDQVGQSRPQFHVVSVHDEDTITGVPCDP